MEAGVIENEKYKPGQPKQKKGPTYTQDNGSVLIK